MRTETELPDEGPDSRASATSQAPTSDGGGHSDGGDKSKQSEAHDQSADAADIAAQWGGTTDNKRYITTLPGQLPSTVPSIDRPKLVVEDNYHTSLYI